MLRLITFNLWWSEVHQAERLATVAAIIKQHNPDVAALQELSPPTLDRIPEFFEEMWS